MKYKYGEYLIQTEKGWGGYGVYLTSAIIGKAKDGKDIIEANGIVAGHGGGWDDNAILDKDWLIEATKRMNKK